MSDEKHILLIELAKICPDLNISIKCSDLLDAFRCIIEEKLKQSEVITANETKEIYLKEEEVRKILNTSHASLHRWHKSGYLVPINIGRKIFYPKSDIEKLLKNKL
ncbi:MAG: helix-turn-helix domain-containing protein [Bacteroidota bacterium]